MNSKEALKRIYNDAISLNDIEEDVEEIKNDYDLIKQDLDKLEQLKKALDILKNRFEVILCESDFPIPEIKYSIGFKFNKDGVWIHISQEEYELLKSVLEEE